MSGDSPELEALFDSVASTASPSAEPPAVVSAPSAPAASRASDNGAGDSPELEALFDSLAAPTAPAVAAPAPAAAAASPAKPASGDSPELESLFDSISSSTMVAMATPAASGEAETPPLETLFDKIAEAVAVDGMPQEETGACSEHVFAQVGNMTRNLHNLLRELGLEKSLEKVAHDLPDNRDRLNYIAAMTAQAAERTLNAAENAQPIQTRMGQTAGDLAQKWDMLFNKQLGVAEFRALVTDTRGFLHAVPGHTDATNAQLMEIIMAQDFQDLTGQVIKKVLEAAQSLEKQLVALLLDTTPEEKKQAVKPGLLEGPIISTEGRSDVVNSQEQVDELLESLGF